MKSKEEVKALLMKKPNELTKEELSLLFWIFCFHIKEYESGSDEISFEIHFRRIFIIEIEYPIGAGMQSFHNDFVDMCDGLHGISMGKSSSMAELITIFINMFYESLLLKARYGPYFDEDISLFKSPEEAQEHLEWAQESINEILEIE